MRVRVGVADHLGWAILVVIGSDHAVVDRRRIELIGPGLPAAPVHHVGGPHEMHRTGEPLTDAQLADLVARVRADAASVIAGELDRLARDVPGPIAAIAVREWPATFPTDIAQQRRAPYESQADPIMYRQELARAAVERGWHVHRFTARTVQDEARALLGESSDDILRRPRATLGPPWSQDHRMAYAAAIVAGKHPDGSLDVRPGP